MNCPLAEAFTKTPSVVYQNLFREFWCTAVATHPNPSTNYSEVCPLKKYKIKFSVMNGKKSLTLDYKTFVESTGLDYAKGTYVSHPSPKADESFRSSPTILIKKKKGKSQTITPTLPQSQGPEAPGLLPQKRKKPKSKKTPSETKVTPPKPTNGSEQPHSVSSGTVPDPQDLERNIQLADSRENVQPVDRGLPFTASDEGATKTTSFPEGPRRENDSDGLKRPDDMKPQTNHVVDPSGTDAKYQEDETQFTRLRMKWLKKVMMRKYLRLEKTWRKTLSLELKKYDNILPLTERQTVKYLRKVSRVLSTKLLKNNGHSMWKLLFLMLTSRPSLKVNMKKMLVRGSKLTKLLIQPTKIASQGVIFLML
nr:hypothetical protein [Tanacetum cinerariifolium]